MVTLEEPQKSTAQVGESANKTTMRFTDSLLDFLHTVIGSKANIWNNMLW